MDAKWFYLYANPSKPQSIAAAKSMAAALTLKGCRFAAEGWLVEQLQAGVSACLDELDNHFSALLCMGGDGTMLRTIPFAARAGVPVLGINLGHTGFLMEAGPHQADAILEPLLLGQYTIQERMMLACQLNQQNETLVMNEVAITRGQVPSSLVIDCLADQERIYTVHGDGVLVSTPTGTTGYCLSAGGPVVHPALRCQVVVPICSHIMMQRPVVLPVESTIVLQVKGDNQAAHQISYDGQLVYNIQDDSQITIQTAAESAKFIRFEPQAFLTRLHTKQLEWSKHIYGGKL